MAKPTVVPEWAISDIPDGVSGVNNVVEPIAAKKNTGFVRNEYPPRQDMNWLFRIIYTWINWFNDSGACDFWKADTDDTGVVTTDFKAGVGGSTSCQADNGLGAIIGASISCVASGSYSAIFAGDMCDVTGDRSAILGADTCIVSGDKSGVLGALDSNVSGNHSVILGSNNCDANEEMSASLASKDSNMDSENSAIISSKDSDTNNSIGGSDDDCHLIGASEDAHIDNGRDCAIIAANEAWVTNDKNVVIGSSNSYALGIASSVISSYDSSSLGNESAVIGCYKCSSHTTRAIVLASDYVSNPTANTVCGGINGNIVLPVPAVNIEDAVNPADARTCTAGGSYTGTPLGTAHPVYEIRAGSSYSVGGVYLTETQFQWRKLTGYDADPAWSSAIAIDPAHGAQLLDDGVTVTFSTDIGWIAGRWTITITDDVAGGGGLGYVQNRMWELDSNNGEVTGSVAFNAGGPDYAEYFENLETGIIPLGTIVRLEGRKVMPITDDNYDNMLGSISGTAGVRLGDTSFAWSKKFLTGDFGEPLYEDELNKHGRKVRKINPDYDGTIPNIKRSERPEEWSLVALIGQVYVRVSESAKPGDKIGRLTVMEITKAFTKKDGYAIAFCLLR